MNEPVDINPVKRDAISDAGSLIDVLDKIVNVAKKVWDIIDESKPVADISTMYATALPYSKTAAQLSGWSSPKGYRYGFYAKNLYGIKTVNVTYKVTFQYGGRYNGRGRYLTAVTVVPENVETLIGYSFYMKAYVPDSTIVNIGTAENPIAALRLVVQWKISTIISSYQSTAVYYITGDGKFRQISGSLAVAYKDFPTPAEDLKYRDITPNYVMPTPVVPITNPGKDSALPKNSIPAKLKRNMDNIFGK